MKTKYHYIKDKRRMLVYTSVHPIGGFVAWPESRQLSNEQKALNELLNRRRDRRGFVAWPEKEAGSAKRR